MAAGVPVVATSVGGTPEVIASDNVGVLVPSRDPAALARALTSLETQSGVRRSMATDARARAETEFSTTAMVNRYLEAYGWGAASDAPTTPQLPDLVADSHPQRSVAQYQPHHRFTLLARLRLNCWSPINRS